MLLTLNIFWTHLDFNFNIFVLQSSDGYLCSLSKSPHQVVYDLYTLLALTDAKGYAMMQFSWMLLRLYGKGKGRLFSHPHCNILI